MLMIVITQIQITAQHIYDCILVNNSLFDS